MGSGACHRDYKARGICCLATQQVWVAWGMEREGVPLERDKGARGAQSLPRIPGSQAPCFNPLDPNPFPELGENTGV